MNDHVLAQNTGHKEWLKGSFINKFTEREKGNWDFGIFVKKFHFSGQFPSTLRTFVCLRQIY